jgi:hypothetical protein
MKEAKTPAFSETGLWQYLAQVDVAKLMVWMCFGIAASGYTISWFIEIEPLWIQLQLLFLSLCCALVVLTLTRARTRFLKRLSEALGVVDSR